ncbi:MAG: PAS domain-containing protein, partial [Microvirga sp.]
MNGGNKGDLARALDLQPCMVRSLDGVIECWTSGCEALYGWTAADAVGQFAQDLLKIQYPEPYETIKAALLKDGEWTGELIKQTRAGDLRCISARWVLDKPGSDRPPRIVESAIDITALKLAAEAVQDTRDRLELAVSTFGLGVIEYDPRSGTLV